MLVLSFKRGEYMKVGDNIYVHLVEVRGGHVKLGIEAPKSVPILRSTAGVKHPKNLNEEQPQCGSS